MAGQAGIAGFNPVMGTKCRFMGWTRVGTGQDTFHIGDFATVAGKGVGLTNSVERWGRCIGRGFPGIKTLPGGSKLKGEISRLGRNGYKKGEIWEPKFGGSFATRWQFNFGVGKGVWSLLGPFWRVAFPTGKLRPPRGGFAG